MVEKSSEQIALDLIEQAVKTESKILDLSNLGLIEIPPQIGKLLKLRKLILYGNKLSSLPKEISLLKNLKGLYLGDSSWNSLAFQKDNKFKKIPPEIFELKQLEELCIGHNYLTKVPAEIGQLKNLKHLDLAYNNIKNLPKAITNLSKLRRITLWRNKLKKLPENFSNLINLRHLTLHDNDFSEIPPQIFDLINLSELALGGNKITNLPREIDHLKNLISLIMWGNYLKELPLELNNLPKLNELSLVGNPLPIPPEILGKMNKPQAILNYYFSVIDQNRKSINEIKLLVVGQGSVGKTSIVNQILYGVFDEKQNKTEGISINQWKIDGQTKNENKDSEVKLNTWDFGGQEIMHATHQFFLTKRSIYLLVIDSRLTQEENRVEYWLKIIQSFGEESPVLIIGNKVDQHPLDIDKTGLQKKYSNIVAILETSAATGTGIEELKAEIAKQVDVLPHMRDLLPETWFTVKAKLEELAKNKNFFTQDEYFDLCNSNEVSDETSKHTLIGFLHDLGVVLHFQDDRHLANLGILNPQWVTNGVYKILNDKSLFKNKGKLTIPLLDKILNSSQYPQNKRLFIVEMMRKFELCYDIDRENFLIPDLLPKEEPENIKFNGISAFEYQYPVLPSSVITRFIVRMNKNIYKNISWRTGVVLKIGENTALVKADIEDKRIKISIDGLEHTRRDALSAIRYQLDEIHESIKGLNPQKRVPIPEAPNAEPLDYDYLLQLERDGFEEHPVKDGNRLFKVNVRKLLSGVVSETERKQNIGNVTNIYGNVSGSNIISGDENQANVENIDKKKPRKKKS